jgi:hypothetical protein
VRRLAGYIWAGPGSLAALPVVALAVATGARARWRSGVVEAAGGWLRPLLARAVPGFPISAITLGHVVLGAGERELEETRAHERAHVRQYERWGALFPILYMASSVAAVAGGRHAWSDNAFERQAEREAHGGSARG